MMRCLLLLLLLCLTINTFAQGRLVAGEVLQVTIAADAASLVQYDGKAGETIRLSATAVETGETTPDLVLWIVLNGKLLAYNDNQGESTNPSISLTLAANGLYSIYVDSFNGVSTGAADLLVEQLVPFNLEMTPGADSTLLLIDLPASQVFRHQFGASGGMSISVKDLSGNLDPYVRLLNGAGETVGANDDHASNDLSFGLFDSLLSLRVNAGLYTLEVRDFLGNAGQLEILVTP